MKNINVDINYTIWQKSRKPKWYQVIYNNVSPKIFKSVNIQTIKVLGRNTYPMYKTIETQLKIEIWQHHSSTPSLQ